MNIFNILLITVGLTCSVTLPPLQAAPLPHKPTEAEKKQIQPYVSKSIYGFWEFSGSWFSPAYTLHVTSTNPAQSMKPQSDEQGAKLQMRELFDHAKIFLDDLYSWELIARLNPSPQTSTVYRAGSFWIMLRAFKKAEEYEFSQGLSYVKELGGYGLEDGIRLHAMFKDDSLIQQARRRDLADVILLNWANHISDDATLARVLSLATDEKAKALITYAYNRSRGKTLPGFSTKSPLTGSPQ